MSKQPPRRDSFRLDDQMPYLLRLDEPSREDALQLGVEMDYPSKAVVMRQGEPSTHVLLIRSGWLKVTGTTPTGHEGLLAMRGPGDVIGESAGLNGTNRAVTVTTLEPVQARNVPGEEFSRFLDRHRNAWRQLLALTNDRWRTSDRQRLEQATKTVRQRLARLLLELAEVHGERHEAGLVIRMPLTQYELAGSVGSSREGVTRLLKEFRDKGLVTTNARRYVVLRPETLRRVSEGKSITSGR